MAGFFNADTRLDLAVACSGSGNVWVLLGNGDGTFAFGSSPSVGSDPWGITAGDVDANGTTDLVTADHGANRVSVLRGNGNGTFATAQAYAVDSFPTGVALVPVGGSARPDIVVSTAGIHTVDLLLDDGAGGTGFLLPAPGSSHPVRSSPQAVVPVDADADGLLDVAVPCKTSDAVVVLLTRTPSLLQARRVGVGAQPLGAAAADLDRDGDLDLAVVNTAGNSVSLLSNDDGLGTFLPFGPALGAPGGPTAVVAADFDRDGILDLAATQSTGTTVAIWRGLGNGTYGSRQEFYAGPYSDDLAAADVDRDGDLDLLVTNRHPAGNGTVTLLRNVSVSPSIAFTDPLAANPDEVFTVGERPEAVFVADFNRDGRLDLAVANDAGSAQDTLTVLFGDGSGLFPTSVTLPLVAADEPVSLTGADFDGDGDVDLAAGLFGSDTVAVFEWDHAALPAPRFLDTPDRIPAPDLTLFAAAADLNRDGKTDLAVAATGLKVLRGKGSLALTDPFQGSEDFVAGLSPSFVVAADWNHDGWPDLAVVNKNSDDVSILLSTACQARSLQVTVQPAACVPVSPYLLNAEVTALDDGGSVAACAVGTVTPALVGGDPPASLVSPVAVPLTSGVASFTGLSIAAAGRRYRLGFSVPDLPDLRPVESRSFTLGPQLAIQGPAEFCTSATYTTEGSWDEYAWKLDFAPRTFTPSLYLNVTGDSLTSGLHRLDVATRVDACSATATRSVNAGSWASTTVSFSGPLGVCVDCVGGTLTAQENGGGSITSRQWGYRTKSGASEPVTDIPGETGATYVLKGTDFPGPGRLLGRGHLDADLPVDGLVDLQRVDGHRVGPRRRGRGAVPGRDGPRRRDRPPTGCSG